MKEIKDVMEDSWMMLSNLLNKTVLPLKVPMHIKELMELVTQLKKNNPLSKSVVSLMFHKILPLKWSWPYKKDLFQLLLMPVLSGGNSISEESFHTIVELH